MTPRRSTLRADLGHLRDTLLSMEIAANRPKAERGERTHPCPHCPRVLRGEMGLRHHLADAHPEAEQ